MEKKEYYDLSTFPNPNEYRFYKDYKAAADNPQIYSDEQLKILNERLARESYNVKREDYEKDNNGNIDWKMVRKGAATTASGLVTTVLGAYAVYSGVGVSFGLSGISLGIPTIGFGVTKIIDGFDGGQRSVPGGPLEATDLGFGGDGSYGQVGDIFSGGLPKTTIQGIIMGYGIYNSNMFQSLNSDASKFSGFIPQPVFAPRDNTNVVIPPIILPKNLR